MGSGRDSRTFQVGKCILVDRRDVFFSCSGTTEGMGGLVITGGGGAAEKNAISEI